MKTKICSRCKKEKSLSEFSKDKSKKDELNIWCRECVKKYNIKNKRNFRKYWKDYRTKYPIKVWCHQTINGHRRRGFKVLFTWKELLPIAENTKYCPICDELLDWSYGKKGQGGKTNTPSLDRINNEKTLTLNNVQIICNSCNSTKRNRTMKEFINYCKKIASKFT